MTAEQLALDPLWDDWDQLCARQPEPAQPVWTDHQPDTPTPTHLRDAEIADLRGQGPGPAALRTAKTVPTGRYL